MMYRLTRKRINKFPEGHLFVCYIFLQLVLYVLCYCLLVFPYCIHIIPPDTKTLGSHIYI